MSSASGAVPNMEETSAAPSAGAGTDTLLAAELLQRHHGATTISCNVGTRPSDRPLPGQERSFGQQI